MTAFVLLKMWTAMACVALAAIILVRDPGFRPNRLMAAVMACIGWWALCEVLWTLAETESQALSIARSSALGWLPVSAYLLHTFAELSRGRRGFIHALAPRMTALAWGTAFLYTTTPWGLAALSATPPFTWRLEFGWLIGPALLVAVVPAVVALVAWRASAPRNGSWGERRTVTVVVTSLGTAVVVAAVTDVLLPLAQIHPPLMGSSAAAVACAVVALHLQRYGFSLLSADAFAGEIIGSLPDGIALVRADGTIHYVNPVLARLVGRAGDDQAAGTVAELMPQLPRPLERLAPGTEAELRCADGRELPVIVSPVAVTHERRGTVGYALIVRDRREVAALRARLVLSARLAAVGDLSAGIAREILRPMLQARDSLADLKLHWQVLALDLEKGRDGVGLEERAAELVDEGHELIDESLEGVDRVTALVRNVQGFAEPVHGDVQETDVNELVEHALRIAMAGAGPEVRLDLRLAPDPPTIACRRSELEQVVVNLVVNALHAVEASGRIGVVTEVRPGGLLLRVEDDGCGIPASMRDHIFDPFFTTKPVGEGTGLGLAICYHIVRNHGGTISVESTRDRGTAFTIDLPAS